MTNFTAITTVLLREIEVALTQGDGYPYPLDVFAVGGPHCTHCKREDFPTILVRAHGIPLLKQMELQHLIMQGELASQGIMHFGFTVRYEFLTTKDRVEAPPLPQGSRLVMKWL